MTYRTVVMSSFDEYLSSVHPEPSGDATAPETKIADRFRSPRAEAIAERKTRLAAFPHTVVLQVAYAELEFANRWCWQQFGPADGECHEAQSEYPACQLPAKHTHAGTWQTFWLEKVDYNFGFNEWCFADPKDRDRFVDFIPQINWGEDYPK